MNLKYGLSAALILGVSAIAFVVSSRNTSSARYPASAAAPSKVKTEKPLPASEPLSVLIACHEAMVARSDGSSQNMKIGTRTPFVFQSGSQILFVTEDSIFTVDNANKELNGRVFQVVLTENKVDSTHEFEVRRNGELGSVCCGDGKPTASRTLPVLNPRAKLTEETRRALKKELYARIRTVGGQYQNKDQQMATVPALENCQNIDFGNKDIVGDLIRRYSGKAASGGAYNTSRGSGAAH